MPSTYEPIATTTLGSAQSTVTFSSIPSTYTDLILISNNLSATNQNALSVKVGNGSVDSGTNYSVTFLYTTGSPPAVSGRGSNNTFMLVGRSTSDWGIGITQFMNYANTSVNKTVLSRGSSANAIDITYVNLWRSSVAINIMTIGTEVGGNISANSTFTLYGIKAA
jgi:hypothetical protein